MRKRIGLWVPPVTYIAQARYSAIDQQHGAQQRQAEAPPACDAPHSARQATAR